jgi:hypothetical protein
LKTSKRRGDDMPTSSVSIYLGSAGLIVGALGLGAQHLLRGEVTPASTRQETSAGTQQKPLLFAQSIGQAALPTTGWPAQSSSVAFYEPMIELMTRAAATSRAVAAPTQPMQSDAMREEREAAPRETARDLRRQQTKQSTQRAKPRVRDIAAAVEPDPRDARAQEGSPRQFDRRSRDGREIEPVNTRSRSDRRRRDPDDRRYREGAPRVVVEDTREPEPRFVRLPEPRETFNPLRIFGGTFGPD